MALQNRVVNPDSNPQPAPDPAVKPQPPVAEVIEALRQTLTVADAYSWSDAQVDRLHQRIRPIDRIIRVDAGPTVVVQRPDGACYQLTRYDA